MLQSLGGPEQGMYILVKQFLFVCELPRAFNKLMCAVTLQGEDSMSQT